MSLRFYTLLTSILVCIGLTTSTFAQEAQTPQRVRISQNSEAGKININTAGAQTLQRLKSIGRTKAQRIVADRTKNGPYPSVDSLTRVKGIGKGTVNKNRQFMTVGGSAKATRSSGGKVQTEQNTPPNVAKDASIKSDSRTGKINLNTADAQSLQSLKSIGKTKAMRIIEDRIKNGSFASIDDLTRVKGIGRGTLDKNRHLITVGDPAQASQTTVKGRETLKVDNKD